MPTPTASAYTDAATIRDHVIQCSLAGVQAGYHVIGDAAMDLVVAGFAEAAEQIGDDVVRSAQHRLEHVEMVDVTAVSLLARLGVTASVQPVFDAWWGPEGGMYEERLGVKRASAAQPIRGYAVSWRAAGVGL